jgi:hypothetical protein
LRGGRWIAGLKCPHRFCRRGGGGQGGVG